jgi:hypothetical protein
MTLRNKTTHSGNATAARSMGFSLRLSEVTVSGR